MKHLYYMVMLLALCVMGACSEDSIEDLQGGYDMSRYDMTQVTSQPTEKLKKGIKALNLVLSDASGQQATLRFTTKEWVLPNGVYTFNSNPTQDKEMSASVQGTSIVSGDMEVTLLGSTYYLNGLFATADGGQLSIKYKGAIAFEIGEDDPEASGYTAVLSVQPVYLTDQNGQVTGILPGMSQYIFNVSNPDGNPVASFVAINVENLSLEQLMGSYAVAGSNDAFTMANGWKLPDAWGGWYGGTWFDAEGTKQFVTDGSISITSVDGIEGGKLYTFEGKNLGTTLGMDGNTYQNIPGTATEVKIMFVTVLQSTGIELRDQMMTSTVLGKEMAYSVYLPKDYFTSAKEYPVLYLLNGADGGNNDWLNGGMVNAYASSLAADGGKEMIVVCPNGCPDGVNAFYCDNAQGSGINYMTYFFDEFVPFIESNLRVKADREHRAIGGLSMGGYGSLYYGALHPEMFSYVYACSPLTYMDGIPNLYDLYGAAIGGGKEMPGVTIEIGTGDFLYESAGYFEGFLASMNFTHDYITRDGVHDWAFWTACTPKMLKKVSDTFAD